MALKTRLLIDHGSTRRGRYLHILVLCQFSMRNSIFLGKMAILRTGCKSCSNLVIFTLKPIKKTCLEHSKSQISHKICPVLKIYKTAALVCRDVTILGGGGGVITEQLLILIGTFITTLSKFFILQNNKQTFDVSWHHSF